MIEVETYEVTETGFDGSSLELEPEALEIVESLGLSGQQQLVSEDTGTRCPYRKMTAEESQVYDLLFSERTAIAEYADEAIPLRVLQVASHATPFFDHLQVWHKPNADIDDPILVGINGPTYSPKEIFILARWGNALAPFAQLRTLAAQLHRDNLVVAGHSIKSKVRAFIDSVESCQGDAVLKLKAPSFYE